MPEESVLASVLMSPAAKENEILTSIPDNATARPVAGSTGTSPADSSPRTQPVALEVGVTVNGARAVAGSDKREPFSESTKTVLIFGHGAVIRLSSSVAPGQLLFLTNEKTKKEVVCQVVNSKNYSGMSGYVELEFTEPVSGFWGMRFPAAPQSHSSEVTLASPGARNFTGASGAESKAPVITAAIQPETKSTNSSSPRAPESVFPSPPVSKNQASAPQSGSTNSSPAQSTTQSSPSSVANLDAVETAKPTKTPTAASLVTPTTSAPAKSMLDSDEIKMPSWLEPLARNAAAASAALPEIGNHGAGEDFGDIPVLDDLSVTEITDTPEGATRGLPASPFGTHFLADERDAFSEKAATSRKSSKKFLIGAIAASGLLLVGAAGWYVRQSSDNDIASSSATKVPVSTTAATTTAQAANNSGNRNERTQSQPPVRASAPEKPSAKFKDVSAPATIEPDASPAPKSKFVDASRASLNANKNIATVDSATDVAATADVAAPPQPKKQSLGAVKLSAPIVNKPAGPVATEEALNFEPSQPAAGLAPSLGGSTSRQPIAPSSGSDIKPATLISSVAPVYPSMARTQRVGGAVTIDALIDATGHVTSMAIVSGPAILQGAAKDALSRWKYAPAQLHGKPVPMHMTVTIQFKLQ
jgi:TonB family protein